jgi:hypothetical protein
MPSFTDVPNLKEQLLAKKRKRAEVTYIDHGKTCRYVHPKLAR